jgi:predicted GNAT superfamily acetyltransferase
MTRKFETGDSASIVIREIHSTSEIRAVEQLQKEVWGIPDLDVVPLSQIVASSAAGGVLIGAFDDATLVGFAYGFVGYEHGHSTHHSHMLAVLPAYRNLNVGYRLKLAQRKFVIEQGIEAMTWTFDPLQSLNAYFNFNRLGVVSDRYLVNFYGEDAASFLHGNGTDRLWVTWLLNCDRVRDRLDGQQNTVDISEVTHLVEFEENGTPRRHDLNECLSLGEAAIEIPADINELERRSRKVAVEWREATRWAFTEAIGKGFMVEGFYRTERNDRKAGIYRLRRAESLDDLD